VQSHSTACLYDIFGMKFRATACVFVFLACQSFLLGSPISYPVSKLKIVYGNPSADLPNLSILKDAYVAIGSPQQEVRLERLLAGFSSPVFLTDEDLFRVSELPLHFLKEKGFEGVVAFPDPSLIDPVSGKDLRTPSNRSMVIVVWVSVIDSVEFQSDGLSKSEEKRLEKAVLRRASEEGVIGQAAKGEFFDSIKQLSSHRSRHSNIVLSAANSPGRVKAVVKAKRKRSEHLSLSASNTGTESTGEWILSARGSTSQLSGLDDGLSLGYDVSHTAERYALTGNYYLPFNIQDSMGIGVGAGYSSYDGSSFAATHINFSGNTLFADLSLRAKTQQPIDYGFSGGVEVGMRLENVEAYNSLSTKPAADVLMMTPRVALSLEHTGKYRIANSALSLFGNILAIDENERESLGGINVTDRYFRFVVSHSENLLIGKMIGSKDKFTSRHLFTVNFQSSMALSGDRHLPHHQFIAGGTGSVRGYPESLVAGDSGYLFSFEYRFPFYALDGSDGSGDLFWTIAPFIDWGKTSVNDPMSWESDHILLATGLSIHLALPYGMYSSLDFATPLRRLEAGGSVLDGTDSGDYRVHGNFGWKF